MEYDEKYNIHKVVSTTTRYPRIEETCGVDYFYRSKKSLCNENGCWLPSCVNPISFGKDSEGEEIFYCYTEEELLQPLKEGKSLFFNLIGSSIEFYRCFFNKHFPNVKFIATC
jgi:hypothetical protein